MAEDMSLIQRSIVSILKGLTSGQAVEVRPNSKETLPDIGPPRLLLLDVSRLQSI